MYPDLDGDGEATAGPSLANHVCHQLGMFDQVGTIALRQCPPCGMGGYECVCVCLVLRVPLCRDVISAYVLYYYGS